MRSVIPFAVAGRFYPAGPDELREEVRSLLRRSRPAPAEAQGLIAPHAGYPCSGPVAASAYAWIMGLRGRIRRVVLAGPAHFIDFDGIATSGADAYGTPWGGVPLDPAGRGTALSFPRVRVLDAAFEGEHALEVHLPFLRETLGDFLLVPLLTGRARAGEVAEVLDALWEAETLPVASSDLSHFHSASQARWRDEATARAIEEFRLPEIGPHQACGHLAIKGLLIAARRRGLTARAVDLRNSSDTGGPQDRVVGYGAFVLIPEK